MTWVSAVSGVLLSVLGISWFWAFGAAYLSHFPIYARETLGGAESVVTLLLVCFSLGIGVGSALCEKLSGKAPRGYVAPWWEMSASTAALLQKYGFTYDHSQDLYTCRTQRVDTRSRCASRCQHDDRRLANAFHELRMNRQPGRTAR